jgi:asparagine synthase (glutamine-hydrolysing)
VTKVVSGRPAPARRLASPARPSCWFVVLADRDPAIVPAGTRRVLRHASGRPWVVGDWPEGAVVAASAGRSRLALVGCAATSPSRLLRLLVSARGVHGLDVTREVAGDYHVLAVVDGQRRVQGSAAGTRRIFFARIGGQVVAADRADVLAELAGARLDPTALALCLLDPSPPYPLDDAVPWSSIEALEPDHYLLVRRDERVDRVRWWRQPEATRSRAEGAPVLREALAEAVAARVATARTASADLSGGLDSTAVCTLACRGSAELVAFTGIAHDPADDDVLWADRAAAAMPGVAREILPSADLPLVFDGIATEDAATDEGSSEDGASDGRGTGLGSLDRPSIVIVDRAKMRAGLERVAVYGPQVHLTGFGGDEIAGGTPNYLPGLARRRPWTAVRHLRGYRAQEGWPLAAIARGLRRRSYRDCLGAMASAIEAARRGRLGRPRRSPYLEALDWTPPSVVPGWLTSDALGLLADAFADAARRAVPLAPGRCAHADMFTIRAGAAAFRAFDQLADAVGPPLAAPLLDERVVSAALAVRPEERCSPWEYKPLLKESLRQVLPEESLRRRTKADASIEEDRGLWANRSVLVKLCDDSPLADLGLVDADVLREALRRGPVPDHRSEALQPTVATDAWLRSWRRRR